MSRRKIKRTRTPRSAKDIRKAVSQKAVTAGTIALFLLFIFVLTKAFLYRSDYFMLRTIEVNNILPKDVSAPNIKYDHLVNMYKGRNIFGINLKKIAYFFREGYPDAKDVRASVVLPDKIAVNITCRWPVAIIKNGRPYLVDDEGYLLSSYYTASPSDFPAITGVNPGFLVAGSKRLTSNNLRLALELLREIKKSRYLMKFGLTAIHAENPASLSYTLGSGVEARIGPEDFGGRLKRLEKTLRDPRLVLSKIDYIDVRFHDAIIGPK